MSNDPTRRALHLLSLLQTHRLWSGRELAERLEVTERTVRRDVDRLRDLGYPVLAAAGADGGYRLGAGAHLPPLLLDDDEAVAVSIGLRRAADSPVDGIEEVSLRALAKIEQVLPDRLRRQVAALHSSTVSLRRPPSGDEVVDPEALSVLATGCRDGEEVRFDYRRSDGEETRRLVEPHQMVAAGQRWYLVAWDLRRDDWRTFRVDRMGAVKLAGGRFSPRQIPGGDGAAYVTQSVGSIERDINAEVIIDAGYDEVARALRWIEHDPVASDGATTTIRLRSDDADQVVAAVARLAQQAPIRQVRPPQIAAEIQALAARLSEAGTRR